MSMMETETNIKELIDSFQKQVDGFKEQLDKQINSKETKDLQKELQEKKEVIATLIDDLKPLEEEITTKDQFIKELGGKLEDNAVEMQKLIEKNEANNIRLEKLNQLLDVKKKESAKVTEENEELKKEIFRQKNKLATLEAKTFQTDDKNQKLTNELIHARQQLKQASTEKNIQIEKLKKELEKTQDEHLQYKQDEEAKKERLMELHAKKITMLNAQIASMKAQLERTEKEIKARTEKEKALISDFAGRLKDITAPNDTPDTPSFEQEEEYTPSTDFYDRVTADVVGYEESKVEEIMPMVEIAMQQGESKEKIQRSLKNSGYKEKEIIEVFQTLKIQ